MQPAPRADFGILTLATPSDYYKAIGLALSLRVSNPGVPVAVACSDKVRPLVEKYFDEVVTEIPNMRGFIHKVYLDKYTPYATTMFFDSDVLVFKDVQPYVDQWRGHGYTACGKYLKTGTSTFGMDRAKVLAKLGKPELVVIDGAGHALFEKPGCDEIFEFARHVSAHHAEYVIGADMYADEDVMDVVMTRFDIPPMPFADFFSRYLSARKGTLKMDVTRGHCEFIRADDGTTCSPCMMHFAADEAPLAYHFQLNRLLKKFDVSVPDFWRRAGKDFYQHEVKMRLNRLKHWVLRTR